MDEDDIGEHMAGTTIQAQSQFDTLNSKEKEIMKQKLGGGANGVLGQIPDEFIITSNDSKGWQLMKAMGYKDRGKCFKSYESDDEEYLDEVFAYEC